MMCRRLCTEVKIASQTVQQASSVQVVPVQFCLFSKQVQQNPGVSAPIYQHKKAALA